MRNIAKHAAALVATIALGGTMIGCGKNEQPPAQPVFDEVAAQWCLDDIDRVDTEGVPVPVVPNPAPATVLVGDDDDPNGTCEALSKVDIENRFGHELGPDAWAWYASAWVNGEQLVNGTQVADQGNLFSMLVVGHLLAWNAAGEPLEYDGHGLHKAHKSHKVKPPKKKPATAAVLPPARPATPVRPVTPTQHPAPTPTTQSKAPTTAPKKTQSPKKTTTTRRK